MKQDRLESVISQIENGTLPKAKNEEEQALIALAQSMRLAGNIELDPDIRFIHQLEAKILKGGESPMASLKEWFFKAPVAWGIVAVLLLFLGASSLSLPRIPFNFLNRSLDSVEYDARGGYGITGMTESSSGFAQGEKMMIGAEPGMMMPDVMPPVYPYPNDDYTNPDRSIVRSASLSLKVKDVGAAVQETTGHVESVGGYVTNSSLNKTEKGYVAYMSVRVPEEEFSSALQYFKRLAAEVTAEDVSAYDQTGQVTGTQEQIDVLSEQLAQYQALLDEAETTAEKIKLQNQINSLERQIQSYEKEAQNLEGRAAMSSISLTFEEDRFSLPLLNELGIDQSVSEATRMLKRTLLWFVVLVIWIVIFLPIWLPAWLVYRWFKGKKK